MRIKELMVRYPAAKKVIAHYGLSNLGCGWGGGSPKTIQQAVELKKLDLQKVMKDINNTLK